MSELSTGSIVAIIGLCINGSAIIWGAAKVSSAVEHLEKAVQEIKGVVMHMQDVVHNLVGRVWVLEDRADIPHRRVGDAEGGE